MSARLVLPGAILLCGLISLGLPAHATTLATDIVQYSCTPDGAATQTVQIRVELTMPVNPVTGQQMTIGHRATYAGSTTLLAPAAGLPSGTKMYAYVSISGLPGLTSGTGVGGTVGPVTAGQAVTLPTQSTSVLTTPNNPGTATIRPAAINFGLTPTEPLVECEVENASELTTHQLTITAGGTNSNPSPTTTITSTETETETATETATETETATRTANSTVTETSDVIETPSGGVATGGGGEAGPDARALMLIGSIVLLAATSGLLLRRRAVVTRAGPGG
ncbi:hypothetical protein GCM10009555_090050 [Acrocarpospora macrocephala]|uniref:Uncharacterized protein n=1 Tax=Acrocarpospora macrocephala TaxID=150177 RepID=A0A5M3WP26_9ACTN|nr:hypothetical protein [Acrocarpospora macrocephala]GES08981.1 hypothetical protein Amac_025770 [Acrocarpospora macrocephala]